MEKFIATIPIASLFKHGKNRHERKLQQQISGVKLVAILAIPLPMSTQIASKNYICIEKLKSRELLCWNGMARRMGWIKAPLSHGFAFATPQSADCGRQRDERRMIFRCRQIVAITRTANIARNFHCPDRLRAWNGTCLSTRPHSPKPLPPVEDPKHAFALFDALRKCQ